MDNLAQCPRLPTVVEKENIRNGDGESVHTPGIDAAPQAGEEEEIVPSPARDPGMGSGNDVSADDIPVPGFAGGHPGELVAGGDTDAARNRLVDT